MADQFASYSGGLTGPITRSVAVTPNDGADLVDVTRALHCNASGNVSVIMAGDSAAVTKAVIAGVTYSWRVKRVLATGTTATVVAEY